MIFSALVTAFQFLTIIPLRTKSQISERDVYNSAAFFPFIGAFQGLFLVFLSCVFLKILSTEIATAFALSSYVLITGGFHLDGLSDTFDALSVKSSGDKERDIEKRLRVMKDSTVGPMGVIAIVFFLLLKYLLMADILRTDNPNKYFLFFLMPVFSKWAMVITMYHGRSARADGIGRTFLEHVGLRQIVFATGVLISFLTGWYLLGYLAWNLSGQMVGLCVLLSFFETIFIMLVCFILKYLFNTRFGGLTGDNFGAIHEITEIVFLTIAILWR